MKLKNSPLWQLQLETAISAVSFAPQSRSWIRKDGPLPPQDSTVLFMLRPLLPYVLEPIGLAGSYMFLNRDRNPLGLAGRDWVDYQNFPWAFVNADEPIAQAGPYYLFSDGSAPWRTNHGAKRYQDLLHALADPNLDLHNSRNEARRLLAECNEPPWPRSL